MVRKDLQNERESKKQLGRKDFKLLTADGIIAFYKECELIHVYLMEEDSEKLLHYFAIISYEEFKEVDKTQIDKFLTKPPKTINKKYKLGISQKRISLEDGTDFFNQLCTNSLSFNEAEFVLPNDLQLLPKTHIPGLWGYDGVILSKILKPNLWGDRYILEFISPENPINQFFSTEEINKINEEILNIIPIDLASVYDRIGSIIFQFPITLVSGDASISQDWCKANLSLNVHSKFHDSDDLYSIVQTETDKVVTGFAAYEGAYENLELNLGDSNNLEFKIFNKTNGLIYKNSMVNFLRSFSFNFGISSQNSEPRVFYNSDGKPVEIPITSQSSSKIGKENSYDTRTKERISKKNKTSKKYYFSKTFKDGEREDALRCIRDLLNSKATSSSEIWLWDPYLQQEDIFDTLYYLSIPEIKMKCITSLQNSKNDERRKKRIRDFNHLKEMERDNFLQNSKKNLGINLDYRAAYGNNIKFHDRFIIFIPKNEDYESTVYSLGHSVNGLGKSYHLVQSVYSPDDIVTTFKELWKNIEGDDYRIIKLPEDIKYD